MTLSLVGGFTICAVSLASTMTFAANDAGPDVRPSSSVTIGETASKTNTAAVRFDTLAQNKAVGVTTREIPPVSANATSANAPPVPPPGMQTGSVDYDDGVISYEHAKHADMNGPPIGTLQDFMSEGDITSPLGMEVREDRRRVKGGGEAEGLLIVDVFAGSPAAHAGLHPYHRAMRDALETAAVAGALFCPPVVLLVPVFDQVHVGESYDLIVGVDGSRVTNFLDFEERMRDVQAGEIVYLSVIRNGERKQIPVPVPDNLTGPTF